MRKKILIILLVSCGGVFGASSKLRFTSTYKVPSEGISFKIPKDWSAQPLPAQQSYSYTRTRSDGTKNSITKYDTKELWMRSQHFSMISGKLEDSRIMFAKLSSLAPETNKKHVERAEYDQLVEKGSGAVKWSEVEVQKQWLKSYTGTEYDLSDKVIKVPTRGIKCRAFTGMDIYALIFYAPTTKGYYCLLFDPPNDIDEKTLEKFGRYLTSGIKLFKPTTVEQKTSRMQDKKMKGGQSAEFLASKEKVINDIKNLEDWWYVETPNYVICSDMPSKYRRLVKQVQQDIETYRAAFEEIMPPWEEIKAVSVVKMFARREDYVNYVGEDLKWSGGVWMPSKQELVVSPPGWDAKKSTKSDRMLKTLYHEAFHQYLHYCTSRISNAVWFNEGHATFFENAEEKSGILVASEDSYEHKRLLSAIRGKRASISKMISMQHRSFYKEDVRWDSYAVSWGLVYYLHKHCVYRKTEYKDILNSYQEELKKSKNWQKASEKAFAGVDMKKFQKDFEAFWTDKTDRRRAERAKVFKKRK